MTEEELMITSIKGCRRIDLYIDPQPLTQDQSEVLEVMRTRRRNGEPLQYILGKCEFRGYEFKIDERTLIPRPETELLVEWAIETIKQKPYGALNILDIGTGCGNIAVSLARELSECSITAVDISSEALRLAQENAQLLEADWQIQFLQSDLFSALPLNEPFDIIISNPPYIATPQLASLPIDVQHEPRLALDGGRHGLDFYQKIIGQAPKYFIKRGGMLFLEIGDGQYEAVDRMLRESRQFRGIESGEDLSGTIRMIKAEYSHG